MQIAKNNSKCSKQKKKSKTKPQKKSEVRDVRKKHMQKIEFHTGVMFDKKHEQQQRSIDFC